MPICISIADDEAISELGSNFSEDSVFTKKSSISKNSKNLKSIKSKSSNSLKTDKSSTISRSEDDSEDDDIIVDIKDFSSNEISRYKILDRYFKKIDIKKKELMVDIINKKSDVSLRILDKFVTKYCSKANISYKIDKDSDHEFNVHISYKAQLKSYRKRFFDPFRRGKKFYYDYNDSNSKTLTTLGQLNFFKWAFTNGIIDYVVKNKSEIVKNISKWDKDSVRQVKDKKIIKRTTDKIQDKIINIDKPTDKKIDKDSTTRTHKIVLSFD